MECRERCGACCIAISISSAIPGAADYKAPGVPCPQLDDQLRCRIFGKPERPACCSGLQPSREMCGESQTEAMAYLTWLELETGAVGGG